MRDRLWNRDWIAIGFLNQRLVVLPSLENAKFGRKPSAVGDCTTSYIDVRGSIRDFLNQSTIRRSHAGLAPVETLELRAISSRPLEESPPFRLWCGPYSY